MSTRIAVQQRQRLFRDGIGRLLDAEADIDVVGTAGTGPELLGLCREQQPDVALLEADGIDWDAGRLVRAVRQAVPGLRVLGLSTGDLSSADVVRSRRSGMRDVLPRSSGIADILAALRAPTGRPGLHRYPTTERAQDNAWAEPPGAALTPRELAVLNLVAAGFTSREISGRLAISHKTVENHKQRIFGKLGVQNQAHAVSVAMRRGLMRAERVIGMSMAD
jgi:DNA-binding NarL/FixJ family response regulator